MPAGSCTVEQLEPALPAATTIMMPASACASTAACNVLAEQPSEGGQGQELIVMSGAFVGSPCAAAYRVWRKEKFHALDVSRRCAVALVHVAATNPFCAGGHPDLVASAVIADRGACCMSAMRNRHRKGKANQVPQTLPPLYEWSRASCNRDRRYSVPAAVMRLERVMCPPNTGVGARNDDVLAGEARAPRHQAHACN